MHAHFTHRDTHTQILDGLNTDREILISANFISSLAVKHSCVLKIKFRKGVAGLGHSSFLHKRKRKEESGVHGMDTGSGCLLKNTAHSEETSDPSEFASLIANMHCVCVLTNMELTCF